MHITKPQMVLTPHGADGGSGGGGRLCIYTSKGRKSSEEAGGRVPSLNRQVYVTYTKGASVTYQ